MKTLQVVDQDTKQVTDPFDQWLGQLHGLTDVTHTAPSTLQDVTPITGASVTYIVRTYRQKERGDYIFVQAIFGNKVIRIPLPPSVANTIARQREALTGKNRSIAGKERAAADKAAGKLPGFMRKKSTK